MTQINLLPWRDERRRQKNKDFFVGVSFFAFLAIIISGWTYFTVQQRIDFQTSRNQYLEQETKLIQEELKEIVELDSIKDRLLSRMEVIQQLQIQRPQVVHLFHELTTTLPDGVHLASVEQTQETITLEGRAVSNASVSAFMRNLDKSEWLKTPSLEVIQSEKNKTISTFKLHLNQTTPSTKSEKSSS